MSRKTSQLTIATRLRLVVAAAVLAIAALLWQSARILGQEMLDAREGKVRALVESVHATIQTFGEREARGELTREKAQQAALAVVKAIRYERREYFWINDLHPRMVMHPISPELDGADLSERKDPTGKRLFVEFVNAVKAGPEGAGFVTYRWPKPGFDQPVSKVSYVKLYQPWGWIVGSGLYLDDVDAVIASAQRRMLLVAAVLGLLFVGAVWLVGRSIQGVIRALCRETSMLAETVGVGRDRKSVV